MKTKTTTEPAPAAASPKLLDDAELISVAGGGRAFRITNIRANANGITGGGPIPANAVAA